MGVANEAFLGDHTGEANASGPEQKWEEIKAEQLFPCQWSAQMLQVQSASEMPNVDIGCGGKQGFAQTKVTYDSFGIAPGVYSVVLLFRMAKWQKKFEPLMPWISSEVHSIYAL